MKLIRNIFEETVTWIQENRDHLLFQFSLVMIAVYCSIFFIFIVFHQSSLANPIESESITSSQSKLLTSSNSETSKDVKLINHSFNKKEKLTEQENTILTHFPFANESYIMTLINHPEIYSDFYEKSSVVENPSDLLVLVNKNFQLPTDYEPTDLVLPQVPYVSSAENNYLRKDAAIALEKMFAKASEEGIELISRSGYRSYATQTTLYDNYVRANGQEQADTYSARPGYSEHQTGLAVDITSASVGYQLDDNFQLSPEGSWLKDHAHEFGFIIRYQSGKENLTGFQYEPWHLRYVGVEVATEITENNWLLEDYLLMHDLLFENE